MCSVNLGRFLGKNNKPENQKVNEVNKDEVEGRNNKKRPPPTHGGAHEETDGGI